MEILAKSGIFDPKVPAPSEDWDFFRRVAEIADVTFVEDILLFKRVHDKNISKQSLRQYLKGNQFAIKKMHLEIKWVSIQSLLHGLSFISWRPSNT